jgi:hypothetical protein
MSSDGVDDTRRYLIQALGSAGVAGLAGCMGGDGNSDSEGNGTPTDSSTPQPTTAEPDYALPESEHADPAQMVRRWANTPGDSFIVSAYSPSKLSDEYGTTLMEESLREEEYDIFEFDPGHIPESFVQTKVDPWESTLKVDQLPNGVNESDVANQLREAGFTKDGEKGDFEIYSRNNTSTTFRAVGQDRHLMVSGSSASEDDQRRNYMNRALQQRNQNTFELTNTYNGLLDVLDIKDSITIFDPETRTIAGMEGSLETSASTVDFESGGQNEAFAFENSGRAETAYHVLKDEVDEHGFNSIDYQDNFVLTEEQYDLDELGATAAYISLPKLLT